MKPRALLELLLKDEKISRMNNYLAANRNSALLTLRMRLERVVNIQYRTATVVRVTPSAQTTKSPIKAPVE